MRLIKRELRSIFDDDNSLVVWKLVAFRNNSDDVDRNKNELEEGEEEEEDNKE